MSIAMMIQSGKVSMSIHKEATISKTLFRILPQFSRGVFCISITGV
jgi:hypothetical protein